MKVLVVEDDEVLAQTLCWLAEEQGDEALVCHDGKSAIQTAHAARPDLVVVDMQLPDIEGTEVCRSVRQDIATRESTVVVHSAFSHQQLRNQAKEAGCHDYFVKGLDFGHLIALFQRLHAKYALGGAS